MTRHRHLSPTKLAARRAALGVTQQQLADQIGVTQQLISRLERGDRLDPRTSTSLRLAAALGVSIYDLID